MAEAWHRGCWRQLRMEDTAAVAELDARVRGESAWSQRAWENTLRVDAPPSAVAEGVFEKSTLAAFAVFSHVADEAELLFIAVRKKSRRRGIARTLIARGITRLRKKEIERVFLEVREENRPARRLYQRIGFTQIGRRRGYYRDGSDAIIMAYHIALPT